MTYWFFNKFIPSFTIIWTLSISFNIFIICFAETESCPKQTGMFQVYSGTLVWRYAQLDFDSPGPGITEST